MRTIHLNIILFILCVSTSHAQTIVHNQGLLSVKEGTVWRIKGNFSNDEDGTLIQNGQLLLDGNWQNDGTATAPTAGFVEIRGESISGNEDTPFYILRINNTDGIGVQVQGDANIEIGQQLAFINGLLLSSKDNLVVFKEGSTYIGADDIRYIEGACQKLGNEDFVFPIGRNGYFKPIAIQDLSQSGAFTAEFFYMLPPNPQAIEEDNLEGLVAVSQCEYWTLDRNGAQQARVRLFFDNSTSPFCEQGSSGFIANLDDVILAHYDGTTWNGFEVERTGNNSTGSIMSMELIDDFSPFTIGFTEIGTPLSAQILNFEGTKQDCAILLAWQLSDTQYLSGFVVEHSTDGIQYQAIHQTTVASGNTNFQTTHQQAGGANYYRLKLRYFNGSHTYSNVLFFSGCQALTLSLQPNPASAYIEVLLSEAALDGQFLGTYHLIDMQGRVVRRGDLSSVSRQQIDVSDLANGNYIFKTIFGQQKIIVQH